MHAVTFAAGLATEGMKPVAAIYSTFLQRAFDQVVHDVCLQNLDVTFALDRAGLVGADGATHQGLYDLAYFRTLPNTVVMAPKDENELRHMLKTAIEYPGPAAVRYPRGAGQGVPLDPDLKAIPIGEAELLRDGDDVAIVAIGSLVHPALEAAAELAADGIQAAVVNARFAKPLDDARILPLAKRCGAVLTLEEHSGMGGFGGAVLEALAAGGVEVPTRVLAASDELHEHGATLDSIGLGVADIVAAARALAARPDIVFADEPTGQLDSHSSAELLSFMRHAVDDYGQTILMVTHEPNAASNADLVLFLADGRIVDEMSDPTPERILDRMKVLGAESRV